MKKFIFTISIFILLFSFSGCKTQTDTEPLHLGVNAIITEIDTDNQVITVTHIDSENAQNNQLTINCSDIPIIYCEYNSGKVASINFDDLQINDEIILSLTDAEYQKFTSENTGEIKAEQIQLSSQRLTVN